MRALILTLLIATAAWPQTSVAPQQLRGTALSGGQIWVTLDNGSVSQAQLDGSLSIDTSGPKPVLRITLPPSVKAFRVKAIAPAQPVQSYQLTAPGLNAVNLLVYRNGLLQSEGDDYTFSPASAAGSVTFLAAIQPGDIIQLLAML